MDKMLQVFTKEGKFKLAMFAGINPELVSSQNQELSTEVMEKALASSVKSYANYITKCKAEEKTVKEDEVLGVVKFDTGVITAFKSGEYKGRIWAGGNFSGKYTFV